METFTFKSIFENFQNPDIPSNMAMSRVRNIVIPPIQRDYAQGRTGHDVGRIRRRILDALRKAVEERPITLDFIYGDIDSEGNLTPLDGQQRLTLLFLLHWYASRRDRIADEDCAFLKRFSYATRPVSRQFCEKLVLFRPSLDGRLSEEIIDQEWFPLGWKNDPTVFSMLSVLDDIQESFETVPDLWNALCNGAITFHFLPIRDLGLTDELYVKMNSRGKPLTTFEHFKAEFEHSIWKINPASAKRISAQIDQEWTDLFWNFGREAEFVDDAFLNYFRFTSDILCYKMRDTPQGKDRDPFTLLETYFGVGNSNVESNLDFLESGLKCWVEIQSKSAGGIPGFFQRFAEDSRLVSMPESSVNYLQECLVSYTTLPFSKKVMLYAFLCYLLHRESIREDSFRERIRIVRNLVENSSSEMSDSEARQGGNRLPAILEQVDSIVIHGIVTENVSINFNAVQLEEERLKISWRAENPQWVADLRRLEDHTLLYGQVGILPLDRPELFRRFTELFRCSLDKVDCALISVGDYWQTDSNGWRRQGGSYKIQGAWRSLFHKGTAAGFDNTSQTLVQLLEKSESFDDDQLDKLIETFLSECETSSRFDWRYYYVKYPAFRPGRYGKYYRENGPYVLRAMWTERNLSTKAYSPYLKEAMSNCLSYDSYGDHLVLADRCIFVTNTGYNVTDASGKNSLEPWNIEQADDGIDTEDRIVFLKQRLSQLYP